MKMDLNPEEELACAYYLKDEKKWKKIMSKFEVRLYLDKKDFESVLFMARKYKSENFNKYLIGRLNSESCPHKYKEIWNNILINMKTSETDVLNYLNV